MVRVMRRRFRPAVRRAAEARALRCGSRRRRPLQSPSRPRRPPAAGRRGPSARTSSTTSSRSRAPSAIFSLPSRLNGTCGSRASNRAASPSPWSKGAESGLAQTLSRRLQEWTGERWMVALVPGSTASTLRETAQAREAERTSNAASHPLVQKVLDRFKGARIVDVRRPEACAALPTARRGRR